MWYKIIFRKRQQAGRWAGTLSAVMLCGQAWDYILHHTWPPWRQPSCGLRQTKPPARLKAATLLTLSSQHKALGQPTCRQSPKLQNDFATLHWRRSEHKAWGRPAGWFTFFLLFKSTILSTADKNNNTWRLRVAWVGEGLICWQAPKALSWCESV